MAQRLLSCQISWFVSASTQADVSTLFREAFGQDPDALQQNKTASLANPILGLASAVVDDLDASIVLQPGRIDLNLAHAPSVDFEVAFGPTFGNEQASNILSIAIPAVCRHARDSFRLAVNMTFADKVDNYSSAMEKINALTDSNFPTRNASDFIFQINSRANLKSGSEYNRILRFNVGSIGAQMVTANAQQMDVPLGEYLFRHLDFNTVPTGSTFDSEKQEKNLNELISEAVQAGLSDKPLEYIFR